MQNMPQCHMIQTYKNTQTQCKISHTAENTIIQIMADFNNTNYANYTFKKIITKCTEIPHNTKY